MTRAILAISALVVIAFAVVIGPAPPRLELYPVMALNDIVAFRRAVSHGAAVARNRQTERACAPIRRARYAAFDHLFRPRSIVPSWVYPGPAFGKRYIGEPIPEDVSSWNTQYGFPEDRPADQPFRIDASGELGFVDELRATVATQDRRCRSSNDEAIDCPASCQDDVLEACDALHARLNRAWHHEATAIWKSSYDDLRATLVIDDNSCELVFERHVDTSSWVSLSSGAEIPIGLIGRPVRWIPRRPSPYQIDRPDPDTFEWQAAATGDHIRGMRVRLTARHGIIVDVRAFGAQSDIAADEIKSIMRDLPVTLTYEGDGDLVIVADASRVPAAGR